MDMSKVKKDPEIPGYFDLDTFIGKTGAEPDRDKEKKDAADQHSH